MSTTKAQRRRDRAREQRERDEQGPLRRTQISREATDGTFGAWPRAAMGASAIVALTIIAYSYLFYARAGFIWDDPEHVINNMTPRTASGLLDIWFHPTSLPQWYPLVHTTFWVEYHLWQLNPIGYHATNVALHALSAFLLWRLLIR